jgi:FAD dependent oxidoreductase
MRDLLIIGAGPAGCAAAIQARRAGLSVGVIETRERARAAPGETLHPGVEPLFDRLGIRESVLKAGFHRHRGVWIAWGRPLQFEPYGWDETGAWLGFQADRKLLQGILLDAVRHAGAKLEQGATAGELIVEMGRIKGVVASCGRGGQQTEPGATPLLRALFALRRSVRRRRFARISAGSAATKPTSTANPVLLPALMGGSGMRPLATTGPHSFRFTYRIQVLPYRAVARISPGGATLLPPDLDIFSLVMPQRSWTRPHRTEFCVLS